MNIAFFDLDKTLLSRNSAGLWVLHELRAGHIRRREALRAFGWLVRYKLGSTQLEAPIRKSITMLRGDSESELRERTLRFYHNEVRHLYRPGARSALETHRRRGDRLVMLTSATDYLAEPSSRELGLDDYLCTRLEIDSQGRFTGEILDLGFGQGKLAIARRYAQQHTVALDDCTFYTDSASDLPVLEAIGTPVVVNPDPKLRRIARARGWPMVDWGRP